MKFKYLHICKFKVHLKCLSHVHIDEIVKDVESEPLIRCLTDTVVVMGVHLGVNNRLCVHQSSERLEADSTQSTQGRKMRILLESHWNIRDLLDACWITLEAVTVIHVARTHVYEASWAIIFLFLYQFSTSSDFWGSSIGENVGGKISQGPYKLDPKTDQ